MLDAIGGDQPATPPKPRTPAWIRRLSAVGTQPSDPADRKLRTAVLTLSSTMMASLAVVWVITYSALGLWASAAIPFAYQLASVISVSTFARTRRYHLFRRSQLWMTLLLPFGLQWSLGGFQNSSVVCLWAFTAPLGALLFAGARPALPWFAAFAGLTAASAAIDPMLATHAPYIPHGVRITFLALNIVAVTATTFALLQYFVRAREAEQERSERLLLNVLPESVAIRLKAGENLIADACDAATVLFADIVGFTPLSERLPASEVVALLNHVFTSWDALAAHHGVEKIKTIGDAYMVVAGAPLHREDHAQAIADFALAMGPELDELAAATGHRLQLRIGIDSGPAIAGVIGRSKFTYDLWGDTVNTASRMESHAEPGTIQVTHRTYALLCPLYTLRPRGTVDVKGKGPMLTHLLTGRRAATSPPAAC